MQAYPNKGVATALRDGLLRPLGRPINSAFCQIVITFITDATHVLAA